MSGPHDLQEQWVGADQTIVMNVKNTNKAEMRTFLNKLLGEANAAKDALQGLCLPIWNHDIKLASEDMEDGMEDFREEYEGYGDPLTPDECRIAVAVNEIVTSFATPFVYRIVDKPLFREICREGKVIRQSMFRDEPFTSAMRKAKQGADGIGMGRFAIPAGSVFLWGVTLGRDGKEVPRVGYALHGLSCAELTKDGQPWHALDPEALLLRQPLLEKRHGDVLVVGLHIGYLASMLSLSPDVASVTVIEPDAALASFVEGNVLAACGKSEKIRIVCGNPMSVAVGSDLSKYDSVLVDTWDGLGLAEYFTWKAALDAHNGRSAIVGRDAFECTLHSCVRTELLRAWRRAGGKVPKDLCAVPEGRKSIQDFVAERLYDVTVATVEELKALVKAQ